MPAEELFYRPIEPARFLGAVVDDVESRAVDHLPFCGRWAGAGDHAPLHGEKGAASRLRATVFDPESW